jgi:hypothetical protein
LNALKGTGFSPHIKATWPSLNALKGTGFSPYIKATKFTGL